MADPKWTDHMFNKMFWSTWLIEYLADKRKNGCLHFGDVLWTTNLLKFLCVSTSNICPNPSHIYISLATDDHWAPRPVTKWDELNRIKCHVFFGNVWGSSPECCMENIGLKVGITMLQKQLKKQSSQRKKTWSQRNPVWNLPRYADILYCVLSQAPNPSYGEWQNSPTWLPKIRSIDKTRKTTQKDVLNKYSISMMMSINSANTVPW